MTEFKLTYRPETADWVEREQFEAFRELLGRAVMRFELDTIDGRDLCATFNLYSLPNLTMSTIDALQNCQFRHTQALIDSDDIIFTAMLNGSRLVSQLNREACLSNGDAALVTQSESGYSIVPDESSLTFKVPRAQLAPLVSDIDSMVARLIPKDNEALRILIQYGLALRTCDPVQNPAAAHLASTHMIDLIALAIGSTGDGGELARSRGLRAARLMALKRDIRARLTQHDLSVSGLAARHGISTSYIRKLFESEGTTFTDFVVELRLARAHRVLSDPRVSKTIGAIAYECGFGDVSYFNRTFRRRYGDTPSDVRERAFGGRG